MTFEQLHNARASAWRQSGDALLTADAAAAWLREAGFTLFLPRTAQIAAPSASFVEATLGEAQATPKHADIENAAGLLRRLLASRDAVALNLLGSPGDQPDFLATEETLPFIFNLRGDREWKRGPRGKSSPLVVEVWKLLSRDGALSSSEIKDRMGRELTEAAALRALTELWTTLRVEPIYSESKGTEWQLLETNHELAMKAGSAMAQGMALSALVSIYLQTAVAASLNEIEAFLSPVASRSRVRDAVRGLTATQQLGVRNLAADELFFVQGSLPGFPELAETPRLSQTPPEKATPKIIAVPDLLPEVPEPTDVVVTDVFTEVLKDVDGQSENGLRIEALSEQETTAERSIGEGRKRFVAQRDSRNGPPRKTFGARPGAPPRRDFSPGDRPAKKPFHAREPWKEDRRPARDTEGRERRPFTPSGERGPFTGSSDRPQNRPYQPNKPFQKNARPFSPAKGDYPPRNGEERNDRKPFLPREGGSENYRGSDRKPFTPRYGAKPGSGDRKPFQPREDGGENYQGSNRKPFQPRFGAQQGSGENRRPFTPRPFKPRDEGGMRPPRKPFPARSPSNDEQGAFPPREREEASSGERRSFASRPGARPFSGDSKPFRPQGGFSGPRKPFQNRNADARPGGERPPRRNFSSREGDSERRPYTPRDAREGGERKPFQPREDGAPNRGFAPRDDRPQRPYRSEGADRRPFKPGNRDESRPYTPRPSFSPRSTDRPRAAQSGEERDSTPRRTGAAPGGFKPRSFSKGPGKPAGKKQRSSPFTSSGKPRPGAKFAGRPGPRSARPANRSGKPGGKGPGKT